jgi:hypothetical protein
VLSCVDALVNSADNSRTLSRTNKKAGKKFPTGFFYYSQSFIFLISSSGLALFMAPQADRIPARLTVTAQTAIQISCSFPGMGAAIALPRGAPSGAGMGPRQNQFRAMAVDAKIQILVTGVTIFLVTFRRDRVRHNKIQRMNLVIQIIALVAFHTLLGGVTFLTFLFIRQAGDTVAPSPVKLVIRRFEILVSGMAFDTIVRGIEIVMTRRTHRHFRQVHVTDLFTGPDPFMASFTRRMLSDMLCVRKITDVIGYPRKMTGLVRRFMAHGAWCIFIMAGIACLLSRQQVILRRSAGGRCRMALAAFSRDVGHMQFVRKKKLVRLCVHWQDEYQQDKSDFNHCMYHFNFPILPTIAEVI